MNTVTLKFDGRLSMLVGYVYGEKIYREQVLGKIDLSQPYTIEFPEQIRKVSSSFIAGFFKDILENTTSGEINLITYSSELTDMIKKEVAKHGPTKIDEPDTIGLVIEKDDEVINKIIAELDKCGIEYEVSDKVSIVLKKKIGDKDGVKIFVPKKDFNELMRIKDDILSRIQEEEDE